MEHDVVELSLYERLWAWFETNKTQALWGVVALAVICFIASFYIWRQGANEVTAAEAYTRVSQQLIEAQRQAQETAARTPAAPVIARATAEAIDGYLKMAAEFPGTAAAERATMEGATLLFGSGKYPEAQAQFERFSRENPDSPHLPQCMLGVAACLDAQGKNDDAARAYENLANRYPGANVAPQAQFALARIFETQGKQEQALILFEKLARADLNSSIGSEAGMRAEELRAKMPAVATMPPLGDASPAIAPAISAAGNNTNLLILKTN